MPKSLKTFNTSDYETSQLQRNIEEYTSQLNLPILDGLLLENVVLTSASTTAVDHQLGRQIRGWFIVKKNTNSNVWAVDANQTLPQRQLVLSASADTTVSLWVF